MLILADWLSKNWIEIFGAVAGIIYVFLEIRQNLWLWPVGIVTSAMYIFVFFTGKLYADMSLQAYYLVISVVGWYWWVKGARLKAQVSGMNGNDFPPQEPAALQHGEKGDGEIKGKDGKTGLIVSRLKLKTGIILSIVFAAMFAAMWFILSRFTDSPVPGWDSFLTSLSVIATWMLARKIYEHWLLWMFANLVYVILFISRGLYPTALLYGVYFIMSFAGLRAWRKSLDRNPVLKK